MSSNLHKKDAKPASGKGGQTAVVKVDRLVQEIRNLAVSCINFVSALLYPLRLVELGLRNERYSTVSAPSPRPRQKCWQVVLYPQKHSYVIVVPYCYLPNQEEMHDA